MKYWIGTLILILLSAAVFFIPIRKDIAYAPEKKETPLTTQTKPLLFVGDMMLGRHVEGLGKEYGNPDFSFASMSDVLKSHITIANLEGPIPNNHVPTPLKGFSFSFPSYVPQMLKDNGITAVSLANNHAFDKGRKGWEETKIALDKAGVAHFGGYAPTEGDYFETDIGEQKVTVYGITMIATGWNEAQALEVTRKLRAEHPGAYLVAFLHWGDEYVTQNKYQRAFAHSLIDSGVDAIIGAHPHVIQGIETYKEKPIFYSLGNFIFDQYFRKEVEQGYVLELGREGRGYVYTIIPIQSSRSVPRIAEPLIREEILQFIAKQSPEQLRQSIISGAIRIPF